MKTQIILKKERKTWSRSGDCAGAGVGCRGALWYVAMETSLPCSPSLESESDSERKRGSERGGGGRRDVWKRRRQGGQAWVQSKNCRTCVCCRHLSGSILRRNNSFEHQRAADTNNYSVGANFCSLSYTATVWHNAEMLHWQNLNLVYVLFCLLILLSSLILYLWKLHKDLHWSNNCLFRS